MSSRTSSRSTLTTVPSTMSPSLKYLMVSSIAARNASSDPMSSMATLGALEVTLMLLVMWAVAPVDGCRDDAVAPGTCRHAQSRARASGGFMEATANLLPTEDRSPRVHRRLYSAWYGQVQPSPEASAPFETVREPPRTGRSRPGLTMTPPEPSPVNRPPGPVG